MTPITQTCDGTFALGNCWKVFQAFVTWQDAETACVAWGAHLASITSASEQAFAANISVDVYTWIGFHDPVGSHSEADWSNFAWSDGSPGGMFLLHPSIAPLSLSPPSLPLLLSLAL